MNFGYEPDDLKIYLFGERVDMRKKMNKDFSSMNRDELEQNIIELTTRVEVLKQQNQWLQEQFNLMQQKRFGASSLL